MCSGKSFQIDLANTRRKFFVSVNRILSKCNLTSDMVKLKLLESHCLPILLYAVESLNLPKSQITELNSWWNSIYRKIFNYHKWESVRHLICMLGRLDLHHIINLKTIKFIIKMSNNKALPYNFKRYLNKYYIVSGEHMALFNLFSCCDSWSVSKIEAKIYSSFNTPDDSHVLS